MRYLLIWGSVLTNAALIISHPTSDFLNEVTDENILVGNAELTDSVADFKIEEALTDNSYPANNVASLAAACKDDDSLSTRSNDQLIAEEKVCPIRTPIKGSQGPANTPGNNGHRKGEPDLYRIMPQNRKDCEDGEIAICTRSFTIGDPIDRDYGYGPGVLPFVVEASQVPMDRWCNDNKRFYYCCRNYVKFYWWTDAVSDINCTKCGVRLSKIS